MRVLVITALIAVTVPVSVDAQQTLGYYFQGSGEEAGLAVAPSFRMGSYGVQLSYGGTIIYDDPYNGDINNVSILGVMAAMPYILFTPFLHMRGDPVPRTAKVLLVGYAALTAVLNSQHHLILYERSGDEEGAKTRALSVFAGPRSEYYFNRDEQWGRYSIASGIRYGQWRHKSPSGFMGDFGFGLEAGVEFPWDIVGGDWLDQDPLVFGGLVLWGDW